ncbi:MAG: peptide chain release factor N(5)-glutamine methyltransferase [Elusimicrobiales bacterium]|nr:peptide chain release factor N(5)-glutamine methyltransferase [Elusimicrobiales bacterium]
MTAATTLTEASRRLASRGVDEPGLNAQWLLADAMGVERLRLLAEPDLPVPPAALEKFEKHLLLKEQGLPLAYITGWQDFRGIRLKVDARVLVPRPETEELAGFAADFLKTRPEPLSALDYGAGSGAIGLCLATEFPGLRLTALEKSPEALACARENALALDLAGRCEFIEADTLAASGPKFDLIAANPPYIPSSVIPGLSPEVLSEPYVALDGGGDGLDVARMLVRMAPARLKKGGALVMELGGSQPPCLLASMSAEVWAEKRTFKDLNGVQRFLYGRIHG